MISIKASYSVWFLAVNEQPSVTDISVTLLQPIKIYADIFKQLERVLYSNRKGIIFL